MVNLCHLITAAGGVGVSDLAVKPENASKHGHEHLVGVLSQTYPKPEVTSVTVPVLERRSITRSKDSLPVLLPSVIIRSQQNDPPRRSADDLGSIFLEHPLKKKADARGVPAWESLAWGLPECLASGLPECPALSLELRPGLRLQQPGQCSLLLAYPAGHQELLQIG